MSGMRVRKTQQEQRLETPLYGIVEEGVGAIADPNCMVALWMISSKDQRERSAEICIFESSARTFPQTKPLGMVETRQRNPNVAS
jgi:hypothetical protein